MDSVINSPGDVTDLEDLISALWELVQEDDLAESLNPSQLKLLLETVGTEHMYDFHMNKKNPERERPRTRAIVERLSLRPDKTEPEPGGNP